MIATIVTIILLALVVGGVIWTVRKAPRREVLPRKPFLTLEQVAKLEIGDRVRPHPASRQDGRRGHHHAAGRHGHGHPPHRRREGLRRPRSAGAPADRSGQPARGRCARGVRSHPPSLRQPHGGLDALSKRRARDRGMVSGSSVPASVAPGDVLGGGTPARVVGERAPTRVILAHVCHLLRF